MDRWEIRPTQTAEDPDRHLLLMRGGPTDVAALLKKFGGLLGRPTPYQGEDFNLSLVVHRLNSETRERLEEFLRKAAPAATPAPAPVPAAPAVSEVSAAPVPAVPVPPTPVPTPPTPSAPIVLEPPAPLTLEPLAPVPPVPAPVPLPIPLPPVPENPAPQIPELRPQIPEIPALVPLTPEPAAAPPPLAVPEPKPEPIAAVPPPPAAEPAAPAPVALTPPTPAPAAAPAGPAPIGFALAARADWTMETLLVGAYNRFAHAAATQVISSPGSMYNPLFLFGVPGTGKSHMLHAIAASLSKGLGGAGVFVTTGPRLSRGVNAAAAAKNMAEIDKKVAESKAFLIDDIHLMAVSDQNKDALAKIFKAFFDRQQQVVITSGYPPRALGALEEALKFSFSKGWSVDLKVPSPAAQKDLIAAAADHAGGKFAVEELALLHEKLSQWGYQELGLWLRRLMILKEMREAVNQPGTVADILPLIYDPVLAGGGEAPRPGAPFQPPPAEPGAAPLAVIVPKDQVGLSTFVAGLFHETGAKYSFRYSYRHALWESYDSQQPFGVPFLIGDLCARAGVTRALVLGPTPDSPLGPRSAEFAQAVRRILDNIGVEMGWVPYSGITTPAHYLNAHLDFAAASRAR